MKTILKMIYVLLRFIFRPVILLFRPIGMRTESIVAVCVLGIVVFLVAPIVSVRFGFAFEVVVMTAGVILAYFLMVWGKYFEG